MKTTLRALLAAWAVLGIAVPARAELVFFSSGRSMSVKGHRAEGDSVVLVLRAGGEIVCEVIQVESAYNERARSKKGAMGLMQLMPETARQYSVSDPYDPRSNIEAGIRHLKSLIDRLPSLPLAIAAYNAGEAAVQRFRGVPPYPETRDYV